MASSASQGAVISVRGVVQGVGFRPFVYRLAVHHGLRGWVRNTSGDVEIEVEGPEADLKAFLSDLKTETPPAALIGHLDVAYSTPRGCRDFSIRSSQPEEGEYQLVSPDIATCPDCLREIRDPANRRYRYPFTNCTNCGPRFTIIEGIPYDRPLTTMRDFTMCPECQREYDNPLDRRFHAQPNACPACGPQLQLVAPDGTALQFTDVLKEAGRLLREGKVLAVRGLGGFQLACDAGNEQVIAALRRRKHRPAKPFAVMLASINEVRSHCVLSTEESQLLESSGAPIVLLRWKTEESDIAAGVAPGLNCLGVMLPYNPLHYLLVGEAGVPLVMTSGNLSEEPIAKDNDEALRRLHAIADVFLLHNRGIYARYDDSVFMVERGQPVAVRRARGYAPHPIALPFDSKQILACGAELKNTFCLTRDNHAFVSQHIGDMENEETLDHFENTVTLYRKLFRIQPEVVACDLHPGYLPTKYAAALADREGLKLVKVQHHHAHIAGCLAENGVMGPVIGVALDGAGYGPDGAIWGGEFMVADYRGFRRAAHLEYVPMPGGALAIKKPYRMALGYLHSLGIPFDSARLPLKLSESEAAIIERQVRQGVNCPLTSSAGRLFDAVAALAGVRQEADYEAQAAIELEMLAPPDAGPTGAVYPFHIKEGKVLVIRLGDLFRAVIGDVAASAPVSDISLKTHRTVAQMVADACQSVARDTGLRQVALSGGVFQNRLLLRMSRELLQAAGFEVLTHRLVPCNDGGISLGQAVVAHHAEGA